jgi:hypothetical protein
MNLNKHNHFTLRITQVFTQLLRELLSFRVRWDLVPDGIRVRVKLMETKK